jgi:branched-chain amino acid transport system substrate-binding protein
MKKIIYIIIVLIVLVGGYFVLNKKKTPTSNEPIKIGVAVDLSGYAANWGESEVKAIQLALDTYKDKINQPVQLVIENTKGTDIGTVSVVKKLIEIDHVQAIIGPTWGDSYQGGLPIAEKAKVVMLSPSAAIETIFNKNQFTYFFSTWWPQESEIDALKGHMSSSGITKLSLVNDQDPFDIQIVDQLSSTIQAEGKINILNRNSVPVGTKDFRTIIAKIKTSKPDAVFIQFADTSLMGPFMKQLKEQNVNIKVYVRG